jgi:N utilization substance protein B
MKSTRRRSREFALQGLYQWQLSGEAVGEIETQLRGIRGFDKADPDLFSALLHGAIRDAVESEQSIAPLLDRPMDELSPVERGILLLGAYELRHCPEVPYRVVINEAVELAKSYGGTDGHKYVNGVLDKLVPRLRPGERSA